MSTTEGTNAATGTVTLTDDQRKALDVKLVKFCASADRTQQTLNEKQQTLITDALTLIDECIENDVYKVVMKADGTAYADGYEYVLARVADAPNFHKAIAHPIAQRLLLLENDKGKRVNSVRKVADATGVSRGVLNEMNQAAKRAARPNNGEDATTANGEQESAERIAAKKAVKRLDGTMNAINDAVADMTADEMVAVVKSLRATESIVTAQFKLLGKGTVDEALAALAAAADQSQESNKSAA